METALSMNTDGRLKRSRVLLILLSVACVACSRYHGQPDEAHAAVSTVTVVPVAKVARTTLSTDLVLTAEFIPYQEIDVMAKEAGYVKSIGVDIGDRVQTGQKLAELEIPEMQDSIVRAGASVEAADADVTTARNDLDRAKAAYDIAHLSYTRILEVSKKEPGLVPQQEVDEARSKELGAEAQLSAAKSSLDSAQRKVAMSKADQARWLTLQKYTVITAPFTGVITKRYANTGAMIQQGISSSTQAMPVVRLSQNDLLRLMLPVPESAVPGIRIGEPVDVTVNTLNRTFPGRVTRFEAKISTATRTMDTEVDVPNPGYVLIPGMYADVDLTTVEHKNVLAVPVEAVDGSADSARVFTVRASGSIHLVAIHTGLTSARMIEVESVELKEGDAVVVGSRASLKEGDHVQPREIDSSAGSELK
jgi:RND family efflux transporter MFP subunit